MTSFAFGFLPSILGASENPPNIVILLADDLGYGELGCQGNSEIPTPHIDGIAARGIRFTSGYVTAAYCSASRAGLMTGRYQARFGYDDNPTGARNEIPGAGLPTNERTLADRLQRHGYATGLIGKWHLGGTAPFHPLRRGFDYFFGFTHEGHFFVPPPYRGVTTMLRRHALPPNASSDGARWTSPDGRLILTTHMRSSEPDYDANNPIQRQSQPVDEHEYLTDALTREAVEFIDRHQDRPFFLYLAYNAVHSPLQGADKYMERFASIENVHRRIFAAMLANLDDSVGAVMQKLGDVGVADNTLVFFLSDNGGPTRELTSSNLPLRGEKGQVYEGGIRVPFVVQWPSVLPSGRVHASPVCAIDIAPTVAAATGATLDKSDGIDLVPILRGEIESPSDRELFWRMGNKAALRVGDWKVVRNGRSQGAKWELFNLANDLSESTDLAQSHSERHKQLVARWQLLNSDMKPPVRWSW